MTTFDVQKVREMARALDDREAAMLEQRRREWAVQDATDSVEEAADLAREIAEALDDAQDALRGLGADDAEREGARAALDELADLAMAAAEALAPAAKIVARMKEHVDALDA